MRVVNRRAKKYTHYIGRPSVLGNPFSHKEGTLAIFKVKDRKEAVEKYEGYARRNKRVMAEIGMLPSDAVLGCWCKPLACHGDVIVRLWEEINNEPSAVRILTETIK